MKKLLLFTFFLMAATVVISQETEPPRPFTTSFGFKGGLNQSYLDSSNGNGYQGLEVYGGFFSETRLSKRWSFQNELLVSFTDDLLFVELPILMRYHLNEKWSFSAGPKIDFLTNEALANETLSPLGVSIEVGAQYNINKRFFVEARLSQGLTNQVKSSAVKFNGARRTFRLGAGFKF